jgi:hypothetical protein
MLLMIGKPVGGAHYHIFSDGADGRSLCTRAPEPWHTEGFDPDRITCGRCARAWDWISHYIRSQAVDTHKNGKASPAGKKSTYIKKPKKAVKSRKKARASK